MSAIKGFIISFCSSSIVLGFLFMLCPSGSISKSVKYIFCLCLICSVVASASVLKEPDFYFFNKDSHGEVLTEKNVAITAQMIFSEALTKQNINFRKITVDTNKLADGSITIDKVVVYTNESLITITQLIGSESYEVIVINE